jgi:hypothetical protein
MFEKTDLPEERYHHGQEHVLMDMCWSHQQNQKLLGLGDKAASAYANINNWCLLI